MRFLPLTEKVRQEQCTQKKLSILLQEKRCSVPVLKKLVMEGMILPPDTLDCAAKHGNLPVLRWITKTFPEMKFTNKAMDWAAEYGYLDVVIWLDYNVTDFQNCTKDAMTMALINGYYEIFFYLHNNRVEGCHDWTVDDMIRTDIDVNMVKLVTILRKEIKITARTIIEAIKVDNLEIINWMYENFETEIVQSITPETDPLVFSQQHENHRITEWLLERLNGE